MPDSIWSQLEVLSVDDIVSEHLDVPFKFVSLYDSVTLCWMDVKFRCLTFLSVKVHRIELQYIVQDANLRHLSLIIKYISSMKE